MLSKFCPHSDRVIDLIKEYVKIMISLHVSVQYPFTYIYRKWLLVDLVKSKTASAVVYALKDMMALPINPKCCRASTRSAIHALAI